MLSQRLIIRGLRTLSSIGVSVSDWRSALTGESSPSIRPPSLGGRPAFPLAPSAEHLMAETIQENQAEKLDRTAVLALTCAHHTLRFLQSPAQLGLVSIGCSRGPTRALESAFRDFSTHSGRVGPLTSPTTTAGALSSTVAQQHLSDFMPADMPLPAACISTSMTCSSAFHSLLVASSFLQAGFSQQALFGGAEACLTPFTLSQLEALRIYSQIEENWPCRPFSREAEFPNAVVLGEGAGTALVVQANGALEEGDLALLGLGWALERIPSATGITSDGAAFVSAMRRAKESLGGRAVDLVIAHAPGSRKGDEAELQAIRTVFGEVPVCTTKHVTGHTYGASGMISLALAQALLGEAPWPGLPYPNLVDGSVIPEKPATIAINTAGFGGNAITAIVSGTDGLEN